MQTSQLLQPDYSIAEQFDNADQSR